MGLVQLDSAIKQIRNKVGQVVYTKGHYGQVVRAHVIPRNPKTTYQQTARSILTGISRVWANIDADVRAAYDAAASGIVRSNVFGENTPLTGFNLFCKMNANRELMSLTDLTTLPVLTSRQRSNRSRL